MRLTKEEFNKMDFIGKVEYLQSDISATMVLSHKYQILISPRKMKEIQEEELEYIKNHNDNIKEETQ